ncbi:MAG: glycyl-radical enzyme activating protein family [Promethearchaeota archaeon CR_4]|nr:MAG: glycyl-radical enzyme activating protein family [Candidatus Lokiarchaeota archaeon CR_4]
MAYANQQPLKALVFSIQKMSTEDGPGIRTTVFFKHCPLRCTWCHNPEGIDPQPIIQWFKLKCIGCRSCVDICPQTALSLARYGLHIDRSKCKGCGTCVEACPSTALELFGKHYSLEELFAEVNKDRVFYEKSQGGVTVSGGEPTMQWKFLREFLKLCKEHAIHTAVDTCGFNTQEVYEQLLPYTDIVLFDLKEMDPAKHKQFTTQDNARILEIARWMGLQQVEIWIRTPIIPGATATDENVQAIGEFILQYMPNVHRWDLCAFLNLCKTKYERLDIDWAYRDVKLLEKDTMEHLVEIAKSTGIKCLVTWSGLYNKENGEEIPPTTKKIPQSCR